MQGLFAGEPLLAGCADLLSENSQDLANELPRVTEPRGRFALREQLTVKRSCQDLRGTEVTHPLRPVLSNALISQ